MPDQQSSAPEKMNSPDEFEVVLPPGELLPEGYLGRKYRIEKSWKILPLGLLTGLGLTFCFNFEGFSWLAFFALVPWAIGVVACTSVGWAMFGSFLLGLGFWLVNGHWVIPVTVAGYLGLCVYLSSYFLLGGWMLRNCYHGRRLPFFLALPIIWVGLELLRGHVITGFSWLLLGHSQYQWLKLIQIADLTGAYGVSFIVAMANGLMLDLLLQPLFLRTRKGSKPSVVVAVGTVTLIGVGVFALVYGWRQLNTGQYRPGPKLAVVQDNFPISVTRTEQNDLKVVAAYRKLTIEADKKYKPDLIVWPESMAQPYLYPKVFEQPARDGEFPGFKIINGDVKEVFPKSPLSLEDLRNAQRVQQEVPQLAKQLGTYLLVGSSSRLFTAIPGRMELEINQLNSSFLIWPDGSLRSRQRYDKVHLVPFGEYIPFRKAFPPLYNLIRELSPYKFDHSIYEGSTLKIFSFASRDGQRNYRFATPICYEGTVPDLCRRFVLPAGEPKIDFLINVSNDGWFNASWELSQHLVCYVFRAVENRVPIARAVNTGISGFVDSDGRIHDLVSENGRIRGVKGISSAKLRLDSRVSIYARTGDWFALLCGIGGLAVFIDSMFRPWKRRWPRLLLVLMTLALLLDAVGRWLL